MNTQNQTSNDSKGNGGAKNLEASLSTLILSIASSAAIALGLAPHPASGKIEKDRDLARFNIDLLEMLRQKTRGNLTPDEQKFIDSVVADLQMKFVST
jgi:hypothetical protein